MESKFSANIHNIKKYLSRLKRGIYTVEGLSELIEIFQQKDWAGARTTIKELIEGTQKDQIFTEEVLCDGDGQVKSYRYTLGGISDEHFIASVAPAAYFSHASALFFNGITDALGPAIYLTTEQTAINNSSPLTQKAIDNAFLKPPRLSHRQTKWREYIITELHRKLPPNAPGSPSYHRMTDHRYTDLERTLIDIVIAPEYGGGCNNILQAFEKSKPILDTTRLLTYLIKMKFAYPYHQAIGFYLDMAGYAPDNYAAFLPKKSDFRFYLQKQMPTPMFNEKWKIYYPLELTDH